MADKNSNKTEQDFCYCSVSEAQEIFGLKDADEVIAQCEANKLPFTKTGNWYRIAVERKRYEEYLRSKQVRPDIDITPEQMDWIFHSTSCRAAVKAGDKTSPYEMELFVKKLLANPNIRYCPHGRPVMIKLSKYDIEKQFGRIQ